MAESARALPAEGAESRPCFLGVERSLTGKRWEERLRDPRLALALAQSLSLPEIVGRILAGRGIGQEDAPAFLAPSLRESLPDPLRLKDMAAAVARLSRAIKDGERIAVFGDYDVDGATSAALLARFLGAVGQPPTIYIPDRLSEGYGPNASALRRLRDAGARVVITVDCGVTAFEPREEAARAGLDVIVLDHHAAEPRLPRAVAVVNPNRLDETAPAHDRHRLGALAAVGVTFLLAVALNRDLRESGWYAHTNRPEPDLLRLLDLVALGTVADAVSLFSPTNRAVVLAGLAVMNRRARPCWQALAALLGRGREPFTVEDLGFQIGPRINARGRVADPFAALNFLTATTEDDARRYLAILDADNQERRDIEKAMVVTARRITGERLRARDQVVCVYDEAFHPGVQGIVASRLVEAYGRVSVVLSPAADPALVTGSLRSVQGVDIARALREVAGANEGLLERFGGHPKAAGVTLTLANLPRFESALADAVRAQLGDARLTPVLWHDGELAPERLCLDTVRALAALEPYGRGFEPPRYHGTFVLAQVRAVGADPVHLSLEFEGGASRLRGIWFRALESAGSPWPVEAGQEVACTYRLSADDYRGGDAVQLIVAHARALR